MANNGAQWPTLMFRITCDICGAVGNLYKDAIRGRHYRDKNGIESFDVRPPLHMGLEAADRAVGAGDYGIPGHLLWIRGGCESLLIVSEYMNILSGIRNRASGDYGVVRQKRAARLSVPFCLQH